MSRTAAMLQMVESACLEMTPAPGVLERLDCVPRKSFLTITCSPTHGLAPTLDLMDTLRMQAGPDGFRLIPHIAARMVRDRGHLAEVIARLHDARIDCIFVPGGDAAESAGDFESSLDLLRAMAELGHQIQDIGVAAHPEGHPVIADDRLLQALLDKQQFATYLVTQMCFDIPALVAWLRHVRSAGVTMPAWIGLPGVADLGKLLRLSMRIGVGQSISLLKRQKGLIRKMVAAKPYQPDELLRDLEHHLSDPDLDISGFHLFSFNDIERTEKWRGEILGKLSTIE